MATTQDTQQCQALTEDGDRCTRSAGEDGFCYQHGPEDETAEDAARNGDGEQAANEQGAQATDGGTTAEQTDAEDGEGGEDAEQADAESDEGAESDENGGQTDAERDEGDADAEQTDAESDGSDGGISGVMDVRTRVESVTSDVVGAPLDRIIEIDRQEDGNGWLVVVEALERSAIPDTEDLLGRYAIQLGQDGNVTGYRLQERYRRSADISET